MAEPRSGAVEEERIRRRVLGMVQVLLYLVFVVIGYFILRRLAPVLSPLLAAALIAYLLDPLVDRAEARGMSRTAVAGGLLVGFLGVIALGLVLLIPLIAHEVPRFIAGVRVAVPNAVTWISVNIGYEVPASWQAYLTGDELGTLVESNFGPLANVLRNAMGGVFTAIGHLAELLLVPVFAFYMLIDWNNILVRVQRMIPGRHRTKVSGIAAEIDGVVANWIRGQFTVTAILAVLYAVAFQIIGIQLAVTIGLLVGLLTVIPFVGTLVGAMITAFVLVLDWQGPNQAIAVGGVFLVFHLLEAAVLTPKIVGHKVGLGEIGALFAVVAGGKLLGLAGVLLAVPIAASVAVLVRHVLRYYEGSAFFRGGQAPPEA